MVKREKANYMIQSVSHAFDVLEEIAKSAGEIGVTELSKRLKLHKNNVFRLLATLELRGYVEQNLDTEDYRLGVKNYQMGQAYSNHCTLVRRAQPILKALSSDTGETVSLVIMQNGEVHFPISIDSKRAVKVAARSGVSFPAKQNAAGRLLSSFLPDSELSEFLAGDAPQDVGMRNQVSELRTSGQIVDKGGIEADVLSLSRIVRGFGGEVIAAIEVLAPQYRAKVDVLQPALEGAATTLSQALGNVRVPLTASIEKEIIPSSHVQSDAGMSVNATAQGVRLAPRVL
jgi:IclR family transcriptional regulator, KDG regulon repressor